MSRHTWVQILCRAHVHANQNDVLPSPRSQIHHTRQAISSQSCVCERLDLQSLCPQHLGTYRECFNFVSERTKERVVSPTSFQHFSQSSETPQSIDARTFVTCLVHRCAVESQSVSWHREHYCCGTAVEISDFLLPISCVECGQELVDPLKPALDHEDRPDADSCLGRHSNFGRCDYGRQTFGEVALPWDKILRELSPPFQATVKPRKFSGAKAAE